jgi:hypothetical protein
MNQRRRVADRFLDDAFDDDFLVAQHDDGCSWWLDVREHVAAQLSKTESVPEALFLLALVDELKLEAAFIESQIEIDTTLGRFRMDFSFQVCSGDLVQRVAFEVDGASFHNWRDDAIKDGGLALEEIAVIRVAARDVFADARAAAKSAIQQARARVRT